MLTSLLPGKFAGLLREICYLIPEMGRQLSKATQRVFFVRLHIENREKPGNLQQVVHALRQMKKFQLAIRITHRGIAADELAKSRAVYVIHVVEIQNDLAVAFVDQVLNGAAKSGAAL